jgi:hypothetical protein
LLPSNFHNTNSSTNLSQDSKSSTSQSGLSKYSLNPDYDDEDCKHPHYLGAEAYYAKREDKFTRSASK